MELKFLKNEKYEVEVEVNDLTIAEILRVYLNKNSNVTFAAWKKEHYTKNPILKVKTKDKDVKSVIKDTINSMTEDLDKLLTDFKNLK